MRMATNIKKPRGTPQHLFEDAVLTASETIRLDPGYNALLVIHRMTGATSGGYVSVSLQTEDADSDADHHGAGQNIPSSDQSEDYTALFTGLSQKVKITLNRTDGTHNVWVIPCVE